MTRTTVLSPQELAVARPGQGESLVLGPFRGPESPHHRIRIGAEGICGWVALHGVPQVIPDGARR